MGSDPAYSIRPEVETFRHAGCGVTLVDVAQILSASAGQRLDLLGDVAFPPPVRQVRLSITQDLRDAERSYVLDAVVRTGADPAPRARPRLAALGNDPIGVFLARRVAAGDPLATRVVDGVGAAVSGVSRRLGLEAPTSTGDGAADEAGVRADAETGLRATVTTGSASAEPAHWVRLRATVPHDAMSSRESAARQLGAMCRLLLDEVAAAAGQPLTGTSLTLSATAGGADRVTLDQVGGLDEIVGQLRELAASFRHPQALARWGARRPQGMLLYGPPGTGKTMLARALANEIGARFREIRTTEILDKWLGASERNIKRIFRDARRYREPTVMLFDEFDSIIGYAGEGNDSASAAINSVAGIFKQEMNNLIEANPNVFVVATTNFPHRIDQSLIRSGRFDIKLAIPAPDEAGRAQIFARMVRQLIAEHEAPGFQMFADDLDIQDCAARSRGMTGADIKEVLRRAQLAKAMQEARTGATATAISQEDLRLRIAELRP